MKNKTYHQPDKKIKEDVCAILAETPHVDCSEIKVSVKDGIVTLQGEVDEQAAKKVADETLDYVLGVHGVKNELTVHKRPRKKMSRHRHQQPH
ncbi:MAG: BON domain-containing protein [Pseudobdellovibrio sp.]|nr:BON domain-containing protein [Pseudobdellovibrio sp.]